MTSTASVAPMASPRIVINGAGLAGLALARCLQARKIPVVVLDSRDGGPRHNYGITLHPWAYLPLLKALNVERSVFRDQIGISAFSNQIKAGARTRDSSPASLRCHCGRLEQWLAKGLEIQWDSKIKHVETQTRAPQIAIEGTSDPLPADLVIATDGIHSITRKNVLRGQCEPKILSFVVINGRRSLSLRDTDLKLAEHFENHDIVSWNQGEVLLRASVSFIDADEVMIDYTYSRPAISDGTDVLYQPDRPLVAATMKDDSIISTLQNELKQLQSLPLIFAELFDPDKIKNDRLLSWLMRTVDIDLADHLWALSKSILLVGDAAHATPILGGEGANMALDDAVCLASQFHPNKGLPDLRGFLEARSEQWHNAVQESQRRLSAMHSPE